MNALTSVAALVLVVAGSRAMLGQPSLALWLLAATLPFVFDVTGGATGFHIAPSDIALVSVFAYITVRSVVGKPVARLSGLAPLAPGIAAYALILLALAAGHIDLTTVAKTLQRLELFLVPLIVGAFVAQAGQLTRFVKSYVVSSAAFALAWPVLGAVVPALGNQKNPAGLVMTLGALLAIGTKDLGQRRYWYLVPLVLGLLWTGSRSSLLGLAFGLLVIALVELPRNPIRVLGGLSLLSLVALIGYWTLSAPERVRLLTLDATGTSEGASTIRIREVYRAAAQQVLNSNPTFGLGIGHVQIWTGTSFIDDPHNVVSMAGAEGGYPGIFGLVILMAATAVSLLRRLRSPYIALALALQVATFTHGFFDTYWVRGKPTLSWMLVGAALELWRAERAGNQTVNTKRSAPAVRASANAPTRLLASAVPGSQLSRSREG